MSEATAPRRAVVLLGGPPPLAMSLLDGGRSDAPRTLLCLHGVGGCKEQWLSQIGHFSATTRVVAPDLRGHGQTPATAGRYDVGRITGDLRQLVEQAGLRTPMVVAAHCYGAVFALQLALDRPDLVSHLVLVGIVPRLHAGRLLRVAAAVPVPSPLLDLGLRIVWPHRFHASARVMRAYLRDAVLPWTGWRRLSEVRQPVLAIAGRGDVLAPPDDVRRMVARIPRGRLGVVGSVRHRIQVVQPARTNRLIEGFLRAAA
jgi:pimeloyl-ACP methyl ester carboxylesterase